MKTGPNQLVLPFIADLDRQAEKERQEMEYQAKRANQIAILRSHIRQYPMTEHERRVIPKGVRLARFVIGWECEKCPYASQDHSLGNKFGIDYTNQRGASVPLICLKDYYKKGYGDKTMLNGNIFRGAKQLLLTKPEEEMSEEEVLVVNAAQIPLNILPEFNDKTTDEGLEYLARLFEERYEKEETQQNGAIPRRDKVRAVSSLR